MTKEHATVTRQLEIQKDDEMPVVIAALTYFDGYLRSRIFTFQQRLQQVRAGAPLSNALDLNEIELLVIIQWLQARGQKLEALCARLEINLQESEDL